MKRLCAVILAGIFMAALPAQAQEDADRIYPYYKNGQCRLVNADGRTVTGFDYNSIVPVASPDGGHYFLAYSSDAESYSVTTLLDAAGQQLTDIRYDYISEYSGYLITMVDSLSGVLGWDGNEILPARYTYIAPTGNGTFITSTDEPYDDIADELYLTSVDGTSEYLNLSVTTMSQFSEGLACAKARNGKYGYLNAAGQWAIEPRYDYADNFADGKAVVTLNSRTGLIDASGNMLLPAVYDSIVAASYVDGDTSAIITITGSAATLYDKQTLLPLTVVDGVNYGYLPGFDLAVLGGDDFSAVYDTNGTELLRTGSGEYVNVLGPNSAILSNYETGITQVVDFFGGVLLDGITDGYALTHDGVTYALCASTARTRLNSNGDNMILPNTMRWGVYDLKGKNILPPEYDSIISVCEGIFSVQQAEWYGLIDMNGDWIYRESDYSGLQD